MEKININDIKPAEYNPRIISDEDYEKLQKSISTFGLVDPIIINLKNNTIIGGHQRYQALQDENIKELQLLKMGDIGYVFHKTNFKLPNEIHEKGLNLALNKISGEFVEEKLQPLLEEINLSNFDIEATGFDELEINGFDDVEITVPTEHVGSTNSNYLKFGNTTIKISSEELTQLNNVYNEYVEKFGVDAGFVTYILENL